MSDIKAIQDNAPNGDKIHQGFLGWQCRLRQYSVRQGDGRPTPGMCPRVSIGDDESLGNIITLIVKKDPGNSTAQFQHMVKRTHDPLERWEGAIRYFSATYYQKPDEFSDHITALFAPNSELVERLLGSGYCLLHYEQNRQIFTLPCSLRDLSRDHPEYQATYWHNSLFNPNIPADARVLCFIPDWREASCIPPLP